MVYTTPDWYLDHWLGKSNMIVGSWEFVYSLDPCGTRIEPQQRRPIGAYCEVLAGTRGPRCPTPRSTRRSSAARCTQQHHLTRVTPADACSATGRMLQRLPQVCAWAPYFDDANLLTELFPRSAAVAERLWSDASVTDVNDAQARPHEHPPNMGIASS